MPTVEESAFLYAVVALIALSATIWDLDGLVGPYKRALFKVKLWVILLLIVNVGVALGVLALIDWQAELTWISALLVGIGYPYFLRSKLSYYVPVGSPIDGETAKELSLRPYYIYERIQNRCRHRIDKAVGRYRKAQAERRLQRYESHAEAIDRLPDEIRGILDSWALEETRRPYEERLAAILSETDVTERRLALRLAYLYDEVA